MSSGLFRVVGVNRKVIREAGKCKCKYPISLADCITIATARVENTKALFREERELKELNIPEVILIGE
ncbi:PIN domain-containing protein [Saccharolobus sp. A20]|uniref:PIN domain-containing protein n=1 Tax=Saccharolobus sp. A20 TaxID=1891280 RepID=UPI001E64223D|nr:PIN domain-containing protein [Sulfolobus sp. A20]